MTTYIWLVIIGGIIWASVAHGRRVRNRETFTIDISTMYSPNGEIERQRKRGYELVSQTTKTLGGHTLVFRKKP